MSDGSAVLTPPRGPRPTKERSPDWTAGNIAATLSRRARRSDRAHAGPADSSGGSTTSQIRSRQCRPGSDREGPSAAAPARCDPQRSPLRTARPPDRLGDARRAPVAVRAASALGATQGRDADDLVEAAGLHGRGGAGFPTAVKMHAVVIGAVARRRARQRERRRACQFQGCAADVEGAPHLVLDGAFLAAAAVGADQVIVGVKVGAGHAREAIARALQERYETEPWTPPFAWSTCRRATWRERSARSST